MSSWLTYDPQNQQMVDKFKELAIITSKEVENAFRCVNRAGFVTKQLLNEAFADTAIRSLPHLHMSSPHIYATVLENLDVKPGMSFLNIGSGTGYFSCLVGYMIKKHGINHGIELHSDLVQFSEQRIADVLKNGAIGTREICQPSIIAGNCFLLDQSQMKYDRVYCGGSCSYSIIKFFLGFLKVGGFLIVPNNTKLIKLQRVSNNEGVKSVIGNVWFAPLTRLDPYEMLMLRVGLLPKLQFPIKSKKEKTKKLFFSSTNFPMSHSHGRKKLSKLRAIQDALDSLERDGSIPEAFCYVPHLHQMNTYKQYNVFQSKIEAKKTKFLQSSTSHAGDLTNNITCTSSSHDTHGTTEYVNEGIQQPSGLITVSEHVGDEPVQGNTADDEERRKNNEICNDIWEHLCTDKLWKLVVENYYSLCATTKNRRDACFRLKAVEVVNPAAKKLAHILSFKMDKNKDKLSGRSCNEGTMQCYPTHVNTSNNYNSNTNFEPRCSSSLNTVKDYIERLRCYDNCIKCNPSKQPPDEKAYMQQYVCINEIENDVKTCVEELLANVSSSDLCEQGHENEEVFEESIDSVLSFQSLSSSTDESLHNSFESIKNTGGSSSGSTSCNNKNSRRKKNKRYVDIQCDDVSSENLKCVRHIETWSMEHDVELVSYLVEERKESSNHPFTISCKLFDKSKLIRHPLISCVSPTLLSYRSIGLLRIVSILDCILDVLIGPSLPKHQFDNPLLEEAYPLESFMESSFQPSDSQVNVQEARNLHATVPEERDVFIYQEAKSVQDEELLNEVFAIISNETSNVKQQQDILVRKLELIDNINEQYKEQVKLLTQQINLIEEQQQLLVEVNMERCECVQSTHTTTTTSSQQLITDRKKQRYALIEKRDAINMEKTSQLAERKELLGMLEQLLSLETRLNHEMMALEKKGMGYLRGEGSNLSHFSQFVSKAERILKKLRVASDRMSDIGYKKKLTEDLRATQENKKEVSFRYQPHTILPRCRFLLPLSKKRYSYIREMLKISEISSPKQVPIIYVDRSTSLNERHRNGAAATVFMQVYESLKGKLLDFRFAKHVDEQWWEVRFSGEGIIDQGGGFRESLVEMAEELCPPDADVNSCLPLFVKTANQKSILGDHQECYTLNPACKHYQLYVWLGKLMGACFRSDEFLSLPLPPYIWKLIVGEYVYWSKDYFHLDEAAVRNIDGLANLDEDAYMGLGIEQTYSTVLSDGSEMELVPNGCNIVVSPTERSNYSELVRKARMFESCNQVKAIREGLSSVIPQGILSCITWENLENGICGAPSISVADLKSNCRYGDDLKSSSQCVVHMWAALASFTEGDRSRFIRFITGRKRLPSSFIISRSLSPKDNLPSASTCACNLFLPEYSSLEVAKEKIKYAIYNCVAIDTDTSPW